MNSSSSTTIEHLPNEILVPILKACASPSLFSVCGRWHHLLANEVMPSFYKQIGKVHVPQGNIKEQSLILEKIYKLKEELSETAKVDAIFKQTFALASSLSPLELEFKWITEKKRYFTLANYSSYLLNINRLLIWKKLPGGEEYLNQEAIKYLPLEKKGKLFSNWIKRYGKDITSLNLREIGLTFLPPEIVQLSQLQRLYLQNNQLTTLPAEIGQLSQLRRLGLGRNHLTTLSAEIRHLAKLQVLALDSNQLTYLPAAIGQLSQLEELHLENNQLTYLPPEIGQLSELGILNLSNNQLTILPAAMGQLSQLLILYLNSNQLTSLPPEIGQLSHLQKLDLKSNQLTALPVEMGQLSQLRRLGLSSNELTSLPAEIGQLSQLQELYLEGNQLTSLTPEIWRLSHPTLTVAYIRNT
ncbi:hypothetical protein DB42_EA00210 [Neochlamydia sp. EPS4]|uniref:leucine-rich repeat domain-containing protein n=1 Tax=Neochlamydia sp. EPS4 TaxID=1478175 RepID=UPI000582B95C|nr:leucine-rich repeat domain-containing protein [Neochlamydia sp. EPS4]KIC76149.1 hypothetical protein DB42_EA00210 [Neochlamydia sp. EPS4]